MEENNKSNLPAVTIEAAKQRMAIALTKATLSAQKMQDEADSLVFNEDPENLSAIKDFIGRTKSAEKTIDKEHEEGKAPYLQAGRAWDNAKKDTLKVISEISGPVVQKYNDLCAKIDRKNREEEQKLARKQQIIAGIESNVLDFSQKIANCTSKKELTDVERLINLEKSESRATKYAEFHQMAIERFNEVLIPIIKEQKIKIEEKEKLEADLKAAQDPEKYDELKEKLEEKENEIIQNQVKVQEDALSQAPAPIEPTYIKTEVKAKRTDIIPEIHDMAIVFKKHRELLDISIKTADAKKLGQTLQSSGAFGDSDELIVDGIKFTIKKQW